MSQPEVPARRGDARRNGARLVLQAPRGDRLPPAPPFEPARDAPRSTSSRAATAARLATAAGVAYVPGEGVPGRRTIKIQGRGAERYYPGTDPRRATSDNGIAATDPRRLGAPEPGRATTDNRRQRPATSRQRPATARQQTGVPRQRPATARQRPARRAHERDGFRPDRAAMWAVVLGVLMLLAAATTSSHAATVTQSAGAHGVRPAAITRHFDPFVAPRPARGAE